METIIGIMTGTAVGGLMILLFEVINLRRRQVEMMEIIDELIMTQGDVLDILQNNQD